MIHEGEFEVLRYLVNDKKGAVWIFALYGDEKTRQDVVAREGKLCLEVFEFAITEEENDPLEFMRKIEEKTGNRRVIINFFEVSRGFPGFFANLDFQREKYVNYPHVLVFWVREFEYVEVMKKAPNFFSRRDMVLDFKTEGKAVEEARPIAGTGVKFADKEDWQRKMDIYTSLERSMGDAGERKTELAMVRNSIGELFYFAGNYDDALEYFRKALRMDEGVGDRSGMARSLNNIGSIYHSRGEYDSALKNYEKALHMAEELGDKKNVATFLSNIGSIYYAWGDYDSALRNYEKALRIAEEVGDRSGIATRLNNIAGVYSARGEYDSALENLEKVLRIDEELGDKSGIATTLNNIGEIFRARGEYGRALENYKKALRIDEELGDKSGIATTLNNIGTIYDARGEYGRALENFEKALRMDEELGADTDAALRLHNIGTVHFGMGEYGKALEYFEKAHEIFKQAGHAHAKDVEEWIDRTRKAMGGEGRK